MAVPPPPPTRGDHQNINYTLIFYGCTIRLTNYCIASIRKTLRALLLIQLLLATWFAIASTATTIQIPAILFCHLSFTADRHQQGHDCVYWVPPGSTSFSSYLYLHEISEIWKQGDYRTKWREFEVVVSVSRRERSCIASTQSFADTGDIAVCHSYGTTTFCGDLSNFMVKSARHTDGMGYFDYFFIF